MIYSVAGDSFSHRLVLRGDDGSPLDLSGLTVSAVFTSPAGVAGTDQPVTVIDANDGVVEINIVDLDSEGRWRVAFYDQSDNLLGKPSTIKARGAI